MTVQVACRRDISTHIQCHFLFIDLLHPVPAQLELEAMISQMAKVLPHLFHSSSNLTSPSWAFHLLLMTIKHFHCVTKVYFPASAVLRLLALNGVKVWTINAVVLGKEHKY